MIIIARGNINIVCDQVPSHQETIWLPSMTSTFATRRESYGKGTIIRPDGSFEISILTIRRHPLLFHFRGKESKFASDHAYAICQIVFLILLKRHTNLAS